MRRLFLTDSWWFSRSASATAGGKCKLARLKWEMNTRSGAVCPTEVHCKLILYCNTVHVVNLASSRVFIYLFCWTFFFRSFYHSPSANDSPPLCNSLWVTLCLIVTREGLGVNMTNQYRLESAANLLHVLLRRKKKKTFLNECEWHLHVPHFHSLSGF